MAIYLGTFGDIYIQRKSDQGSLQSVVNPSDVNVGAKRFSFDFDINALITGDQIDITSTNGAALSWVGTSGWSNGVKQSNGKWFVNVDELGGIRLYNTFADALLGGSLNAITLDTLATNIPIRVSITNAVGRILGCVTNYELNTQREAVDTTALSEQFRSQWSSLMSGSGRFGCQWDYVDCCGNDYEVANYLLQLILRTEVGSEFSAKLVLKKSGYNPSGNIDQQNDELWYDVNGVLTACAIQFAPGTIVEMTAEFITTGPIRLRADLDAPSRVLKEDNDGILLEQDATASLLQDATT